MNKYHAKRCEFEGIKFASKGEMHCYQNLRFLEKAGYLKDIECHVIVNLVAGIGHKTDFRFYDVKCQTLVYAEFKGMKTDRWRLIKKLWKVFGPAELRVYVEKNGYQILDEVIFPSEIPNFLIPPACPHCKKIDQDRKVYSQ